MLVLGFSGTREEFDKYLAGMLEASRTLPGIKALTLARIAGYSK